MTIKTKSSPPELSKANQKIMKLNFIEKLLLLAAIVILAFGFYRFWQVYESGREWNKKLQEAEEEVRNSLKTPKKPVNWDKTLYDGGKG